MSVGMSGNHSLHVSKDQYISLQRSNQTRVSGDCDITWLYSMTIFKALSTVNLKSKL